MKKLRYLTGSTIFVVLVIGAILALNVILQKHDWQLDLTKNKTNTLSKESQKILKDWNKQNKKVTVTYFISSQDENGKESGKLLSQQTDKLSKNINLYTDKISFNTIDPVASPTLVPQIENLENNSALVVYKNKKQVVTVNELLSINYETGQQKFNGEKVLLEAILKVTADKQPTNYFIEGHGEFTTTKNGQFMNYFMQQKGINISSLNLLTQSIPEDADSIYIINPEKDFQPEELTALESYLSKGGNVFLALPPFTPEEKLDNLKNFTKKLGITVTDSVLVDPVNNKIDNKLYIIPKYNEHDITKSLIESKLPVIIPYARALEVAPKAEYTTNTLLKTSTSAWMETNLNEPTPKQDPVEPSKEFSLAVALQKDLQNNKKAKLIIVGNSLFLRDDVLSRTPNGEFLVQTMKWFDTSNLLLNIETKDYVATDFITLKGNQGFVISIITVILLPLTVFALGIVIFFKRR